MKPLPGVSLVPSRNCPAGLGGSSEGSILLSTQQTTDNDTNRLSWILQYCVSQLSEGRHDLGRNAAFIKKKNVKAFAAPLGQRKGR